MEHRMESTLYDKVETGSCQALAHVPVSGDTVQVVLADSTSTVMLFRT